MGAARFLLGMVAGLPFSAISFRLGMAVFLSGRISLSGHGNFFLAGYYMLDMSGFFWVWQDLGFPLLFLPMYFSARLSFLHPGLYAVAVGCHRMSP